MKQIQALLFFWCSGALLAFPNLRPATARVARRHRARSRASDLARHAYSDFHEEGKGYSGAHGLNQARMDLRNFLTQRSIQSFAFVLNQCREQHTVGYLEHMLNFKNLDSFHGTGALNFTRFPEWDSLFIDLAHRDPEVIVLEISQPTRRPNHGWAHQGNYIDGAAMRGPTNQGSSPEHTQVPSTDTDERRRRHSAAGSYLESLSPPIQKAEKDNGQASAREKKTNPFSSPWKSSTPPSPTEATATSSDLNSESKRGSRARRDRRKKGRKTRKEREQVSKLKSQQKAQARKMKLELSNESTRPTRQASGIQANYLESLSNSTLGAGQSHSNSTARYIQPNQTRVIEYEFEIDPAALVTRLMSVREQISKEWKEDLDTIVRTNERILIKYEEKERDAWAALDKDEEDEPTESESTLNIADSATSAFDSNAMQYLANSIASQDRASTPFRRSNFDLLVNLCTQESIHRVLLEYSEDMAEEHDHEKYAMLDSFYKQSVQKFFDGHQYQLGQADNFLETLLSKPPIARDAAGGGIRLISPFSVVEDIVRQRSAVAREWKAIVSTIPDEHLDLRRILFTRQLMELNDWNADTHDQMQESQTHEPGVFE